MPGLAQVAEARSQVTHFKTGVVCVPMHDLFTSLTATQALPAQLLAMSRGPWAIENRLFRVKDDRFSEDCHVLQRRHSAATLCGLRNVAMNLLRENSLLRRPHDPMTARSQYFCAGPLTAFRTEIRLWKGPAS